MEGVSEPGAGGAAAAGTPDRARLDALVERVLGDLGAAVSAPLVYLGDRLGLYRALAVGGPMTPAELAARTGTAERYVREWLACQAAGGYVSYDAAARRYFMTPEQAAALADESSPAFLLGGFQCAAALAAALPRIAERFRTGGGLDWGEHDPALFEGAARFSRPAYEAHLATQWIPALEGVREKLERGAKVADVGCGFGGSTIVLARAFPRSTFFGFDAHAPSIEAARKSAQAAGVAARVAFEVARATDFPGRDYDLVAHFDCLHDLADPLGAARRVRETLAPDGTWMIVEPAAGDRVEENFHPIGRILYAASALVCVGVSLAGGGPALGAQAGEARIREIVAAAGFSRVRRAAGDEFHMVLEARP